MPFIAYVEAVYAPGNETSPEVGNAVPELVT